MNKNFSYQPRLCTSQTKQLINLLFFLMGHPFSSTTEISYYPGFQKNINTVKKMLNFLVKNNLVYAVHKWHKLVFVVAKNILPEYLVTVNMLILQEHIFTSLNSLDFTRLEIREFISNYKIQDFRAIPKKTIRRRPLENIPGLEKSQDPIYQMIVKYLKNLFLELNTMILENERAEKEDLDKFYRESQRQRREGQIYELLVDFKNFLDEYGINNKTQVKHVVLLKKAKELDRRNSLLRYCYFNLAHEGPHSSVVVSSMIADKMQRPFDMKPFGIQSIVAKKNPLFADKNGDPNIGALMEVRRIQNADDSLSCYYDDIGDLSWATTCRKLSDRAKYFEDESLLEKAKSPFNLYYLECD